MKELIIFKTGPMTQISKLNRVIVGFVPGIIIPVVTLLGFYIFKSHVDNLFEYIKMILAMDLLSNVLSLCALPNLIIFFLFLSKNYYYGARGVIFATFLWVLLVVLTRYFL